MAEITREMLWKAYPAGLLPVRGVRSVAGFTCTGVNSGVSFWSVTHGSSVCVTAPKPGEMAERRHKWRPAMGTWRTAFDLGEFLPNVDVSDVATWACLKRDLADAIDPAAKPADVSWRYMNVGTAGEWLWCISWPERGSARGDLLRSFEIDVKDPALALVLARMHLHTRGK